MPMQWKSTQQLRILPEMLKSTPVFTGELSVVQCLLSPPLKLCFWRSHYGVERQDNWLLVMLSQCERCEIDQPFSRAMTSIVNIPNTYWRCYIHVQLIDACLCFNLKTNSQQSLLSASTKWSTCVVHCLCVRMTYLIKLPIKQSEYDKSTTKSQKYLIVYTLQTSRHSY